MRKNIFLIIYEQDNSYYYLNSYDHREDGPAIICHNATKYWIQHNLISRLDGPAIEWHDGEVEWYYKDIKIDCDSQEEFERHIRLIHFQ